MNSARAPSVPRAQIADVIDMIADALAKRLAHHIPPTAAPTSRSTEAAAFLDEKAVAKLVGLSRRTLQGWRARGQGPKFRKAGSRVLYRRSDVESFLGGFDRE